MARRAVWEIEVHHEGLNKYRLIRGYDRHIVEQKAIAQKNAWEEMWRRKKESERKRKEREAAIRSKEAKKSLAIEKTREAKEAIDELERILQHTLSVNDRIDWSSLLNKKPFSKKKPKKPKLQPIPPEPLRNDPKYQPNLGFFDRIFSSLGKKKQEEAEKQYLSDHKLWVSTRDKIDSNNSKSELEYRNKLKEWEEEKHEYEENQRMNNELIEKKKEKYMEGDPEAVVDYCEMVLGNSIYPEYFPQEWDIDYQKENKILIVDYSLPDIDSIPTVKSVKYVISRDEFSESHMSSAAINRLYDSVLYQIALRTIHELYEADAAGAIESIVFNGWVDTVDKSTGQDVNSCIMSVQASKGEFLSINLEKVDPKACFKKLKGVGSSKLHGLSPVAPILSINKEDRRFMSAYEVIGKVDDEYNLATMDWQDFENLIREIFEKEFSSSGGEVKITQASKDGGVDAIAFDPDPIRGGKIVIQAKRYTNTVGVSAVRDLYGTTVNEGATKGILVTTADFGPDAYDFAKGKPLTLLNGNNLLHLLGKYGHKARIDLREAKKILKDKDK